MRACAGAGALQCLRGAPAGCARRVLAGCACTHDDAHMCVCACVCVCSCVRAVVLVRSRLAIANAVKHVFATYICSC